MINDAVWFLPFLTVFFMLSAAFFTGTEIAVISSDRLQLKKKRDAGSKGAGHALYLIENADKLLTTTQFGTNFSIAASTTLATLFTIRTIGAQHEIYIMACFTLALLIFCDSLPKVLAKTFGTSISPYLAGIMLGIMRVIAPVIFLLSFYTRKISVIAGLKPLDTVTKRNQARAELHSVLNEQDMTDGGIKHSQKRMIQRILQFSNNTVKQVMFPLVKIDAIENVKTVEEAVDLFEETRHSKMPVFEERVDNIIGVVHFWDLFFCENEDDPISKYMKPCLFVPEYQQIDALIAEMKSKKTTMAIVVDEYGGAVGMVTKEDIIEEVVGNLEDEFDDESLTIHEISDGRYIANVTMEINDLNERLNINIPKGEYETLSGFLLQQFNRIPSEGDELYFSNLKFRVYRASDKSIRSVVISILS